MASDIDCSIIVEVLPGCDQGVALGILEADAVAIVDAIEVLDSSDNRLCGIVLVDLDSERYPGSCFGPVVKEQLEGYRLPRPPFLCRLAGRVF